MSDSEPGDPVSSEDQQYFLAVERHFLELRGAPMLLSPADWQIARGWRELGVPLPVVHRVLDRVFEQRRERGAKGRIQGLRYFDDAVRATWAEILELRGPVGPRAPAVHVHVTGRLEQLAARLPATVPERESWMGRVLALGEPGAETARVEEALAVLDRELLAAARSWLSAEELAAERREVERALDTLRGRLDAEGLDEVGRRLLERRLRDRFALPELSLFTLPRDL